MDSQLEILNDLEKTYSQYLLNQENIHFFHKIDDVIRKNPIHLEFVGDASEIVKDIDQLSIQLQYQKIAMDKIIMLFESNESNDFIENMTKAIKTKNGEARIDPDYYKIYFLEKFNHNTNIINQNIEILNKTLQKQDHPLNKVIIPIQSDDLIYNIVMDHNKKDLENKVKPYYENNIKLLTEVNQALSPDVQKTTIEFKKLAQNAISSDEDLRNALRTKNDEALGKAVAKILGDLHGNIKLCAQSLEFTNYYQNIGFLLKNSGALQETLENWRCQINYIVDVLNEFNSGPGKKILAKESQLIQHIKGFDKKEFTELMHSIESLHNELEFASKEMLAAKIDRNNAALKFKERLDIDRWKKPQIQAKNILKYQYDDQTITFSDPIAISEFKAWGVEKNSDTKNHAYKVYVSDKVKESDTYLKLFKEHLLPAVQYFGINALGEEGIKILDKAIVFANNGVKPERYQVVELKILGKENLGDKENSNTGSYRLIGIVDQKKGVVLFMEEAWHDKQRYKTAKTVYDNLRKTAKQVGEKFGGETLGPSSSILHR